MAHPLPSEYTFGKVVGRAVHAIADSAADEDHLPEARPAVGKVTFKPRTSIRKAVHDYSAFVIKGPVTAAPPQPGPGITLQTLLVPPGGAPDETLVRDAGGALVWMPVGEVGPRGDSAYATAVAEGFVGTEAEWLESLVGPAPVTSWAGTALVVDDRCIHDGIVYVAIQAHTTQAGWEPPVVPALWAVA